MHSDSNFRSSAAPKGVKLAPGYRDRTLDRSDTGGYDTNLQDDKGPRIKALEDQMKLGQLERGTFEQLRDSIIGGDLATTHLVKGLDWKLLERTRRGEVFTPSDSGGCEAGYEPSSAKAQLDEELAKVEQKEIAPLMRSAQLRKRGELAPPPAASNAGQKRTRSDILAELKASRRAAGEAQAMAQGPLGAKFRRVGQSVRRIGKDKKHREVLITVDEDGNVKRKVRKLAEAEVSGEDGLLMPDKDSKPLGMVVPEVTVVPQLDDSNDDIFEGVGDSYNPLGTAEDDGSSVSNYEGSAFEPQDEAQLAELQGKPVQEVSSGSSCSLCSLSERATSVSMPSVPPVAISKNDYFNENIWTTDPLVTKPTPFADTTIVDMLKRAAALESRSQQDSTDKGTAHESSAARRLLPANHDRDFDDIDLGFGSSRFGDEDDESESRTMRMKLSEWKGAGNDIDDDDDEEESGKVAKQRKRGKKKGMKDKTNAVDVLKAIERMKGKSNV